MRKSQMRGRGRRRGFRGLVLLAVLAAAAALAWLPGRARARADSPAVNVLPSPVHVEVTEPVAVADSPTVTPPAHVGADEAVGVTDGVTVAPPPQTPADEAVGIGESVTVRVLGLATHTTLVASANPVRLGTAVTLTAQVVTASGQRVPDGSVTLRDGQTVVAGPRAVSVTGSVRFSLPRLPLGSHVLRAVYRDTTSSPTVSVCSHVPRVAACRERRSPRATHPYAPSTATLDEGVYDYALSLSPGDLALPRSGSGSVQARLALAPGSATRGLPSRLRLALGGLAGKAILSAPATIAFPQSPVSPTTAPVHVTARSTMLGNAAFSASAGGQTATATLHVYDYTLALAPSSRVVERGRSTDYTVTATLTPGSSTVGAPATIPLQVSGLGAGTSSTLSGSLAFPTGGPTDTQLQVTAGSAAATGSFTLAVSGSPGGKQATANLTVETVPIPTPTIPVIVTLSTQTTLSSSANPALKGASVTFTAHVTTGSSDVTSGSVTLKDGSTVLAGPTSVDASGKASFSLSTLAVGSHTLTAAYGGTGVYQVSSGTLTQGIYDYTLTVNPAYDPNNQFSDQYIDVTATPASASWTVSATLIAGSATAGAPASIPLTVSIPGSAGLTESFSAPLAFPASGTTQTTLTVTADPNTVKTDINNPFLIYIDAASGTKEAIAGVYIPPQ